MDVENHNWTGMLASILEGDADVIFTSLTQSPLRFEAVNFLLPIGAETYGLFISR